MKFRLEWISSYLPGPVEEASRLRHHLTDAGFIVEGVEGTGPEAVLDVEVTANRPDGMSHRGLAREAAAALGRPFAEPAPGLLPEQGSAPASALASVTIEDASLCSRYSARVMTGIEVLPATAPVLERLTALGMNPISGPVDATNHVLWDVGQPLHAFDLDTLAPGAGGLPAIVVRRARVGEKLVTFDGVERNLDPRDLVIADGVKPVALAGVMGGQETAISARTTRILLESAHFEAGTVRRTARRHGMHTDASHLFERGTDPDATVAGLDRAARLILESCGGTVAPGVVDVVARPVARRHVVLRWERVGRFLGLDVSFERARAILASLGFTVAGGPEGLLDIQVPSWRVDVELEADLIEEIIRHVGYASLPETLPPPFNPTWADPLLAREERVRDLLSGAGFVEVVTYSFVSADENAPFDSLVPGAPALVENPLGEPFSTMRATPAIGLLRSARHNVRRGQKDLALFEVGRAFWLEGSRPREERRATVLLCGRRGVHWSSEARPADLFDATGALAAVFAGLGLETPRFEAAAFPFLEAGRSARAVTADGVSAGWAGVVAAALAAAWDLGETLLAEVCLDSLPASRRVLTVEAPSRYPGSEVDVTVTHLTSAPFHTLESAIRGGAPGELAAVEVKGRYQGPGVDAGLVKTTVTLRFSSETRSLAREEVNTWRDDAVRRILALGQTRVDGVPIEEENG